MEEPLREILVRGLAFGFVIAAGIQDLRNRRITAGLLTGYAVCGAVCAISEILAEYPFAAVSAGRPVRPDLIADLAARVFPGTVLILSSAASGGKIGVGDGLFFLASALYLPGKELILWFLLSMAGTFCLAAAAVLLGKNRSVSLPYLSAAAAAFAVLWISGGGS